MSRLQRYLFVDHLRGLIMAFMGLDHASNYFNAIWARSTYDTFLLDSAGQFVLRYLSYLCAPGFLLLAGAMVWLSLRRRIDSGVAPWSARLEIIRRGAFLILVQLVWVNASWSAFDRLRLDHFGIIATIGSALIFLALVATWRWQWRLALALAIFLIHPFLLRIPYNPETQPFLTKIMWLFVDSAEWNLYPILPWFALSLLGSVMAQGWFLQWNEERMRRQRTLIIGLAGIALFFIVRLLIGKGNVGYGNLVPYDQCCSVAFFFVQKYPPSLAHNFLFFGVLMLLACLFMVIGDKLRGLLRPLEVYGRTPFFFYVIHIPLLALVTKRTGLLPYRQGEVGAALIAWVALLVVMYPLCLWFGKVKARSKNALIRMM